MEITPTIRKSMLRLIAIVPSKQLSALGLGYFILIGCAALGLVAWGILTEDVKAQPEAESETPTETQPEAEPETQPETPTSSFTLSRREQFIQRQPVQYQDELRALINTSVGPVDPDSLVRPPLNTEPDEALVQSGLVITDETTSSTDFTLPSLWWIQQSLVERFDSDREEPPTRSLAPDLGDIDSDETDNLPPIIDTWIAYRGSAEHPRRVDLVVNERLWDQLTYLERYSIVEWFGTSAQEFGYSMRVFADDQPVSLYVCDFSSIPPPAAQSRDLPQLNNLDVPCLLLLSARGRGAVSGSSPLSAR